jgi:hypothetical protein
MISLKILRRNTLRLAVRFSIRHCSSSGAHVDAQFSGQRRRSHQCCREFLPRHKPDRKVTFVLFDLVDRLWPSDVAPHSLNESVYTFREGQEFSRERLLHCKSEFQANDT